MKVSPSFVTEIFESCENTKETHFDKMGDVLQAIDLSRIYSLASNQLLPLQLRDAFTSCESQHDVENSRTRTQRTSSHVIKD